MYVCVWVLGRDRVLRLYILLLLLVYWMITIDALVVRGVFEINRNEFRE